MSNLYRIDGIKGFSPVITGGFRARRWDQTEMYPHERLIELQKAKDSCRSIFRTCYFNDIVVAARYALQFGNHHLHSVSKNYILDQDVEYTYDDGFSQGVAILVFFTEITEENNKEWSNKVWEYTKFKCLDLKSAQQGAEKDAASRRPLS